MIEEQKRRLDKVTLLVDDRFADPRRAGTVIGSKSTDGTLRRGTDAESVISIDNGALRIRPLIKSGWGRSGIRYGPYQRENGLAFGVFMLNGHNSSQGEPLGETLKRRMLRWTLGNLSSRDNKTTMLKRLISWPFHVHKRPMAHRLRWWRYLNLKATQLTLDENLAIGWFPHDRVDPLQGNLLVMHALGPESGELWASVGSRPLPAVRGVQNLQILYVIVLRKRGAAYYAASHRGAFGLGPHPELRPLAIDPFRDDDPVEAGIYQSVLGQIGFRVDTRVYGARVARIPALSNWYGTAHAADSLSGSASLQDSEAEIGGRWYVAYGAFTRTQNGAVGHGEQNLALLYPDAPSGLVHVIFQPIAKGGAALIWRGQDADHHWELSLSDTECLVSIVEDGIVTGVAASTDARLREGTAHSIQILDDGQTFALYLDGVLLFGRRFQDARLGSASGVGLWASGGAVVMRDFEAHARTVSIPEMSDFGHPWNPQGQKLVFSEQFDGEARPLDGKSTTSGNGVWMRTFGQGHIDVVGENKAQVRASAAIPNPGRVAYTVAWEDPEFADLQVEITPPGTARDQGEKGRCGLIFWQDAENYVIVSTYLDDHNPGTSISSFFYFNGFEEIYDAIWTLIPRHIAWGQSYRLHVVFDGVQYLAYVNDEPVLYRALTDVYPTFQHLSIQRVGLVVNWEWGDDTGSTFRNFVAKADRG